jgi:hypothetical protein
MKSFWNSFTLALLALVVIAPVAHPAQSTINPILFVTQMPIPNEINDSAVSNVFVSVVSPLGNHLADTTHAGRGGDLWLRYTNGALLNLTRKAGFGTNGVQHGIGIAVRDPFVHWSGQRALFSMVVGAPTNAADTNIFHWQLYELTNLNVLVVNSNATPAIAKVSNQPLNYNNVMACYGSDGRIIFACDRPRNGAAHLYPQLDEYNDVPSNSGLWSFDPAVTGGDLFLLDHSPSGDFHPFVDSFGRLIFTRWDHLVQDRNATDDRMGRATNGTFNYFDEASTAYNLSNRPPELFPEPRTYDTNLQAQLKVSGNALNEFLPWMCNEDGTGLEVLNHVGRHELLGAFRGSSFTNDPNLVQQFTQNGTPPPGGHKNTNYLNNFMEMREDAANPGTYFGIDSPDFGTHGAGQIVSLFGPPGTNGEQMYVTYITPQSTDGPNSFGIYRNPLPMTDGALVAAYTPAPALDSNIGTASSPKSRYSFRLMTLVKSGSFWTTNQYLTPGLTNLVGYFGGPLLITNTGALWELQPVEVVARPMPANHPVGTVASVEAQVFAEEGVPIPDMQSWMRSNNLALLVSRDVTRRDRADREQPFNLRVPGGVQTVGTGGKIYDISYIQFMQADQLRGLTFATTNPTPGRRVLATPMHDFAATNFNAPITNDIPGASRIGLDGSQATFVPARRAMSHQTVDNTGQHAVRERYWISYQPGEIRTCAVCHGLNTQDQAGNPLPTNSPAALRALLRYWKDKTGYAKIFSVNQTNGGVRLDISGGATRANVLEASADLTPNSWTPILTNSSSTNGLYWLLDPAPASTQRFYRIAVP